MRRSSRRATSESERNWNQNGSAWGLLPWSFAGAFPFGGPFTEGPLTAGAAAAAAGAASPAGAAGDAAAGDAAALAPGATFPGFGTPPAAGAADPGAAPPPAGATGAGAGLAPSEHPVIPLTATANADVATAHHRHRMDIERDPPEGRVDGTVEPSG